MASPPAAANRETAPGRQAHPLTIAAALLAVYLIWGSTYLAIRIAVHSLPPFLMAGTRFLLAGGLLFILLRWRREPAPSRQHWAGSLAVGAFLLLGGMGGVAFAEQRVASGLAATMIATTPLWMALFGLLFGHRPNRMELLGLTVGFVGVAVLNFEHGLRANPVDALILLAAAASWALGSLWSRSLPLPEGLMGSAAEMLAGGLLLTIAGVLSGERPPATFDTASLGAYLYLIVIGSLVAFSAYMFLLRHVRPALATSYAYVNPVVAVALGVGLAGEHITRLGLLALLIILAGVILVLLGRASPA